MGIYYKIIDICDHCYPKISKKFYEENDEDCYVSENDYYHKYLQTVYEEKLLSLIVDQYIKDGWVPIGGPIYYDYSPGRVTIKQALLKKI